MALTKRLLLDLVLMSWISLVVLQQKTNAQGLVIRLQNRRLKKCKIDKIYQLGDSISDTGNCIRDSSCGAHTSCARLPYGLNFFKNATGRCSDGLLIIDFIALECGLPLLNPYKDENANFTNGADFSVVGATALPTEILAAMNIVDPATANSLSVQLDWMSSHFETTCGFTDCPQKLNKSLFLVGEIGGNDFNYGLQQGRTIKELRSMVPEVIQAIIHGVRRVIGFGATQIIIPGYFPIGCFPVSLTQFMTNNSSAYDKYHCLKDLNNLAIFYNHHLRNTIQRLKNEYPKTTLIYGDYYNAYLRLLQNALLLDNRASKLVE